MSKNKSLLKSGLVLSVMTLASRIMGLVREMTRASFLGTSMYSDAFTTSFMIPNLLRRLFAENSISVAFIPTFKDYLESKEKKETQDFLKATFTLISFLTTCVVVLGIIVTPFIAQIFCKKPLDSSAADFALQMDAWLLKKQEVTILTRIMFPYLLVISIAAFFQGILNAFRTFLPDMAALFDEGKELFGTAGEQEFDLARYPRRNHDLVADDLRLVDVADDIALGDHVSDPCGRDKVPPFLSVERRDVDTLYYV